MTGVQTCALPIFPKAGNIEHTRENAGGAGWELTPGDVEAIDAAHEGDYGTMVALRGTEIVRVPLSEALAEPKLLDPKFFETVEVFFG